VTEDLKQTEEQLAKIGMTIQDVIKAEEQVAKSVNDILNYAVTERPNDAAHTAFGVAIRVACATALHLMNGNATVDSIEAAVINSIKASFNLHRKHEADGKGRQALQ
jgi:hypothetical protein